MAKNDGLRKTIEAAGFKSFYELEVYSGMNERTLYNWFKKYPIKFECMLKGAIQQKNENIGFDFISVLKKIKSVLGDSTILIMDSSSTGVVLIDIRYMAFNTPRTEGLSVDLSDSGYLNRFSEHLDRALSIASHIQKGYLT